MCVAMTTYTSFFQCCSAGRNSSISDGFLDLINFVLRTENELSLFMGLSRSTATEILADRN
jgi:hypothetical protein